MLYHNAHVAAYYINVARNALDDATYYWARNKAKFYALSSN
jgi:hypothetical protein